MKRICVFAGSSPGARPEYKEVAILLAQELISHNLNLVYGGAKVGLMGILADSVLQHGGYVIGVIPESLKHKEVAHEGVSELRIDYGPGYRVYYKKQGRSLIILLAGGDKRTQSRNIKTALRLARNL